MSSTGTTSSSSTTSATGTVRATARPSATGARRRNADRSPWTCPNCLRETRPPRKRCADCGTSRY